jgi:polyisoprenyl-teichoic acid--peptidoglycan teichoic acid transferase
MSDPQTPEEDAGRGHPWGQRLLRGLFSSLVPGTGQLLGGARSRAYSLLAVTAALVAALVAVIIVAAVDPGDLSAWVLEPSLLLGLLVADGVLLLFRLYAVVDAVWSRQKGTGEPAPSSPAGARWKLPLTVLGLVLLLGFTVFPHAWLGYQYVYKSYDTLRTVFVAEAPQPAPSSTAATIDTGDDGRLTILFTGCDAGPGRLGARADTNIVASFDLNTGRIALFSVPRNTGNAPLTRAARKALGVKVWPNWLTELYNAARRHPELAPQGGDPGEETMRGTLSLILGIPIDYYAVVNMAGLVDLVDALGGVDLYFETALHASSSPPRAGEDWLVYDFKKGWNHLDGRMALVFARTRIDSSDYVRMGRQRCVVAALIDQTNMKELIWRYPAILSVVRKMVRTDIPIDVLQQLARLRPLLKTDEMITMAFQRSKYTNGKNGNPVQRGWILDYKLIQSTVQRVLNHPEQVIAAAKKTGLDNGKCWQAPQAK